MVSAPASRSIATGTLARLLFALAWLCAAAIPVGCKPQQAQDPSQIPHTPIPKTDARLQLANNNGQLRYQGVVADETTRDGLLGKLQAAYGSEAGGEIALDPHTNPPPWAGNLGPLLDAFRMQGAILDLQGRRIELGGAVSDEDRAMLLRKVRKLYPGYELTGLFQGVDMRYALPDADDPAGLVAFLNRIPIGFQSDSGMIVPASLDGLGRAARGIKNAHPDTRLQVGVRAEKSDMPDYDRQIASQRAEAVRLQLAIRGVNPGRLDPIALPADGGKPGTVEFSLAGAAAGPPPQGTSTDAADQKEAESAAQPAPPAQAGNKP